MALGSVKRLSDFMGSHFTSSQLFCWLLKYMLFKRKRKKSKKKQKHTLALRLKPEDSGNYLLLLLHSWKDVVN